MNTNTLGILASAHTGITVSSLEKAVAFYRDVLGFSATPPMECRGDVFGKLTGADGATMRTARIFAPGHTLELVQYVQPSMSGTAPARPLWEPGAMHLSFQVEDIDRVVAAVAEAGVVAIGPVQTILDGPRTRVRGVYTKDGDGVVIELIEIHRREDQSWDA